MYYYRIQKKKKTWLRKSSGNSPRISFTCGFRVDLQSGYGDMEDYFRVPSVHLCRLLKISSEVPFPVNKQHFILASLFKLQKLMLV